MSDGDDRPRIDVRAVAALARLSVRDEDVAGLQADLERLLEFVDALREIDVEGVEPMLRPVPTEGALRDDVREPGLAGTPLEDLGRATEDGRLVVPRTLDTDA